jgi:hypothetical protein
MTNKKLIHYLRVKITLKPQSNYEKNHEIKLGTAVVTGSYPGKFL